MNKFKQTMDNFERLEHAIIKHYGLDLDLIELMPYFNDREALNYRYTLDDDELKEQLKEDIKGVIISLLDTSAQDFDDIERIKSHMDAAASYLLRL